MSIPQRTTIESISHEFDTESRRKAVANTLASLHQVASVEQLTYFSNRSIAEVQSLQEEVSAVIPAGNIVGLVMGGLIRLRDRSLPPHQAKSDVNALMRGLEMLPRHILPRTVYGTLFVGPAAVLAAYQKLLTLTGKDPNSAFPDGLWQFYLEYAMREDAARHANETTGFHRTLAALDLKLSPADQLAAWVCAVSQIYFQYNDLLYNEWRERVYLHVFEKVINEANLSHKISFKRLPQAWAAQRPYHRGADAAHDENYTLYRRRRFNNFLQSRLSLLPVEQQAEIEAAYTSRANQELPAYQRQMSLLAVLMPDRYRENRIPLAFWQTRIGVVLQGRYYLLPAYQTDQLGQPLLFETQQPDSPFYPLSANAKGELRDPQGQLLAVSRNAEIYRGQDVYPCGYLRPAVFQAIRRQVAAIFKHAEEAGPSLEPGLDEQLVSVKRIDQERARRLLPEAAKRELQELRSAPVIINWDEQNSAKPLSYIRRGKRGVGDHALTIFRTSRSIVFDQSHIFFDGVWGMALAEILSSEAASWAGYFNTLATPEPASITPYSLKLAVEPALEKFSTALPPEVSAESQQIDLPALYNLCKLLPKRHPALKLTITDMLILYRCEFGHEYQHRQALEDALFEFRVQNTPEAQTIYETIHDALTTEQAKNPSIVIPMDATASHPHERIYPTTFRNPFTELWVQYRRTVEALQIYTSGQDQATWLEFTDQRRSLLGQLNYFGQLMRAYKKVALEGGSTSTMAMKLLAHLPDSLLSLLDEIPKRVDILNEVLKGEEVFSNVGRVARGSSLTRFVSAKDDNDNKRMVWGVVTDDNDVLHVSLRDFRPHVSALHKANRLDLAELILEDYLKGFVTGFNQFVKDLLEVVNANATHASKEVVSE